MFGLFLCSLSLFAQKENDSIVKHFREIDSISVMKKIDNVIRLSGKDYKLTDKYTQGENIYFEYEAPEDRKLVISLFSKEIGGNESLEVKGEKVYFFNRIVGKFLDIYPFWENEIKSGGDKEKIANDEKDYYPDERLRYIRFTHESSGYWVIKF